MVEDLYFIRIVDRFSSGLLQRQSTLSHLLLTKDVTKAKFFRTSDDVKNYIDKVSPVYPLLQFHILFGSLEVKNYEV